MGAPLQDDTERDALGGVEPVVDVKRSAASMTVETLTFKYWPWFTS